MIQVTMFKDNGLIQRVKISGHSGYSVRGSDIVCSAVSTISQGILGGIMEVAKCEVNILADGDGELDFMVLPDLHNMHHCQLLTDTLDWSLKDIAEQHGEYVSYEEVDLKGECALCHF